MQITFAFVDFRSMRAHPSAGVITSATNPDFQPRRTCCIQTHK